jgi:hypothetical protein
MVLTTPNAGTPSAIVLTNATGLPESSIVGSTAATSITEGAAGDAITRVGVETTNVTSGFVVTNGNSTNNNTSTGLIVGATGTSTGGVGELVFDVSGTGDIFRLYHGGSVSSGTYTPGTLEAHVDNSGDATFAGTIAGGSSITLGANGGTGGSVVIEGSTSGSATINASSSGVLALPSGTTATNMALTTATLGSSTATTQSAGDNSTKVATTAYANTVYNLIQTSGSPYTLLGLTGTYWNNTSSGYTFQLDAPVAGKQYCFGNYQAKAQVITIKSTTSVTIYYKGVAGTTGTSGSLVSGGALGDFVCMEGTDTTTYMVTGAGFGTWTNN